MKQRLLILAAAIVALGFLSGPVQAHHGGAAFDQSQSLTFSGTVTQLEFANPHVLGVPRRRQGWRHGEVVGLAHRSEQARQSRLDEADAGAR